MEYNLISCMCGCKCPNKVHWTYPICGMCIDGLHNGRLPVPKGPKITCPDCSGTGGIEDTSCITCHGLGFLIGEK